MLSAAASEPKAPIEADWPVEFGAEVQYLCPMGWLAKSRIAMSPNSRLGKLAINGPAPVAGSIRWKTVVRMVQS